MTRRIKSLIVAPIKKDGEKLHNFLWSIAEKFIGTVFIFLTATVSALAVSSCNPFIERKVQNFALGSCSPLELFAGEFVSCRNQSNNSDYVIWSIRKIVSSAIDEPYKGNFGIGSKETCSNDIATTIKEASSWTLFASSTSQVSRGKQNLDKIFDVQNCWSGLDKKMTEEGKFAIQLTAMNESGKEKLDVAQVVVKAKPSPSSARFDIEVRAVTDGAQIGATRVFPINIVVSSKGGLSESDENHSVNFTIPPDEKVVSWTFHARSINQASGPEVSVAGQNVTARFNVRSGPVFDRRRGWVDGDLVVSTSKATTSGPVLISRLNAVGYGDYEVKDVMPNSIRSFQIKVCASGQTPGNCLDKQTGIQQPIDVNGAKLQINEVRDRFSISVQPQS